MDTTIIPSTNQNLGSKEWKMVRGSKTKAIQMLEDKRQGTATRGDRWHESKGKAGCSLAHEGLQKHHPECCAD